MDLESEAYQTLAAYMIRLKPEDFENPDTVTAIAKAGNLTETEFVSRFGGGLRPPSDGRRAP